MKAAFPEGSYRFDATTILGESLIEETDLTHTLLPAPGFSPMDGEVVDPNDVVIVWSAVPGADGYVVEVENDDLGVNITAELPPDVVSFTIPPGFLIPGVEYEIGVGTLTEEGNLAIAEGSFVTSN